MFHCSENDRRYYSAALVNRQVEFVKYQPPNVKNLIRLVKYWRKTCIEDKANGSRLPSSYPLELITIHCWEKAGRPGSFDTRAGFKSVLQRLVGYHQINAVWYENYDAGFAAKGKACMPINDRRFVSCFCLNRNFSGVELLAYSYFITFYITIHQTFIR